MGGTYAAISTSRAVAAVAHDLAAEGVGNRSTLKHLSYAIDPASDLVLVLHPGALFLDVRDATRNAKLLTRGLNIRPFGRGRVGQQAHQFDVNQLELALKKGGLSKV